MTDHETRRLFFALPIDSETGKSLKPVFRKLSEYKINLTVVSPENYHITLKFLGNVREHEFQSLIRQLNSFTIEKKTLSYTARGLGAFPAIRRARVLWCGIQTDTEYIEYIKNSVEDIALNVGIKREKRRFKPHLTLARVRKKSAVSDDIISYIEQNRDTEYIESVFSKLVLYESRLSQDGPQYTELESITLL